MIKIKSLHLFVLVVVFILCFLSVWCNGEDESVVAPMKRLEVEALYNNIQAFVGKWWNGSDLYPDPCGWTPIQGVSCDLFDGFWYVTELSIGPAHDNSLTCVQNAKFSPHLFALSHLKSLSFFNCFNSPHKYPISIPTHNWQLLANLESLEFRSNRGLTGQVPSTIGELKNLKSLVLVENGLHGELQSCIGNLVNLKRLNLAGNSFTGKIPDNFGGLNCLLILDLSRNSLSGSLPLTFGGLTSLLKLDLSYNQLEGKIIQEIGNLHNLTLLDLSNNRFSGGLTKSLQNLCSLQELVISNNPIGGDLMVLDWLNLKGLSALDLSNTSLTDVIPESISGLKGLRFLGLNDNMLTGDVSLKLENLPNISGLYINGNNLTGEVKFSQWFYGKMGRRFGAWNNPNLCCSTSYGPIGVKKCQQEGLNYEAHFDSKPKLGSGEWAWNNDFNDSVVSLGNSVCGVERSVFLVQVVLMVIIFIFFSI